MEYLKNFSKKISNSFSKLNTPTELILFVTQRCNARCRHCFIEDLNNPEELSVENFEKVAGSLIDPLNTLVITGGEPFLRDDIIQIYECFAKHNKPHTLIFCTNGLLEERIYKTTKEIVEKYPGLNVKVQFSLDGLEETHNGIRNVPNIFTKTIKTINRLTGLRSHHKNLDIIILTVISTENYSEIEALGNFIEENVNVVQDYELIRGSDFFNIPSAISSHAQPYAASCNCPSLSQLQRLAPIIYSSYKINSQKRYPFLKDALAYAYKTAKFDFIVDVLKRRSPLKNCGAGKEWGVIYPSGDVGLCEMLKPIGNLSRSDYDFNKLWNTEQANKTRKAMKCYCTHSCFLDRAMFHDVKSYTRMAYRFLQFYLTRIIRELRHNAGFDPADR